jgi:hypothetical protein
MWVWVSVAVVAVVTLATIAAAGGLRPVANPIATPSGLRTEPAGAVVNLGAATITLDRAIVNDDTDNPGRHLLGIVGTVTVTSKQTWTDAHDALRLQGVAGIAAPDPDAFLLNDAKDADGLQPGITVDVVFAWNQTAAVPKTITVVLQCESEIVDTDSDTAGWFLPKPCVQTVMTVQDRTAAGKSAQPSGKST